MRKALKDHQFGGLFIFKLDAGITKFISTYYFVWEQLKRLWKMYDIAIARILHILSIVLWIGGVAFVTLTVLPAVKRFKSKEERIDFFERVEHRFAKQSRITTLLAGLTGIYLVFKLNAWDRFLDASFWWMHTMVLVWLIFTLLLFILEPFLLHKKMREKAKNNPEQTFRNMYRMHIILLLLSLITIIGAVAGSHGWLFF